jgi:hypothetical protein
VTQPEYQLLYIATRQDFQEGHKAAVRDIARSNELDWGLVYETAAQHGVAPLIFANVISKDGEALHIPADITHKFELNAYSQVIEKKKAAQRLKESLTFFSKQGIDVMLAKGIALEQLVYDQPWFTAAQDIDLILRRRLEDISPEELHDIQHTMHNSGIEYDFYTHHDLNINGALPVDFDRIWDDAPPAALYEEQVYLMAPEDLLISVCINSCRKRFFRLKSMCDIAETVRKFSNLDWGLLAEKAISYDCTPIIYTALQVTDQTLGCPVPDGVVSMLKVNRTRKWLLDRTIKLLAEHVALSSYPFSGATLAGRQLNLAIILPYLNYHGYQIWRKLREIKAG